MKRYKLLAIASLLFLFSASAFATGNGPEKNGPQVQMQDKVSVFSGEAFTADVITTEATELRVVDANGRQVWQYQSKLESGVHRLRLKVKDMTKGLYFLEAKDKSKKSRVAFHII